jgi:hypothetical protein
VNVMHYFGALTCSVSAFSYRTCTRVGVVVDNWKSVMRICDFNCFYIKAFILVQV